MVRVAICQPVLRNYRVPVFDLLGARDDIELTVFSTLAESLRESFDPGAHRFRFVDGATRPLRWLPGRFAVQPAQLAVVDPESFQLVILPWDLHFLRTLWPAVTRGRARGVRVVLWGHGYSKQPGRLRDALRNRLGRRADAVLVYSRTVRDALVRDQGFDEARVLVAQNTIDQGHVHAARTSWLARGGALADFQSRHALDPGQTIIFVSRLLPSNRADLLLHGLARLRARRSDAKLVVVGDGPDRARLERLADDLGQAEHVVFTGAIFDEMELAPWMLSAALFSYPENIGLSLLHAFGYGLPVVTSLDRRRHNPEIEALQPDVNGLLYRNGDVEDLVDKWSRIMDDESFARSLGRAALTKVEQQYTLPNMVQGFLDAVSLVDGRRRSVE